ncbi:hypothetical protein [Isoptericola sp. NPDC056134]|uniref:hypothetical protein n=1 Tax=Isoptericola sp. NPDC056134 TaxID=3345723 RepID=UPI0035EF9997
MTSTDAGPPRRRDARRGPGHDVPRGPLFLVDRAVASTTTQHESYAAVGTVELVADGDVVASGVTGERSCGRATATSRT